MRKFFFRALIFGIIPVLALCAILFLAQERGPAPGSPEAWQAAFEKELGPAEHTKVDHSRPLHEQTRIFEIAGRTFEIPIMYINGRPKPGLQQDSMLLEVIWPDMRSIHELKDRGEYEMIWREERRLGGILIEPSSIRPSLDDQEAGRLRNAPKNDFVGEEGGLEKYIRYRGKVESPELWSEVYILRDEMGRISVRIECRSWKASICLHKFIDSNLIYQLRYNKDVFFSQWRDQQKRAIEFMASFEVYPKQER